MAQGYHVQVGQTYEDCELKNKVKYLLHVQAAAERNFPVVWFTMLYSVVPAF